MRHAIDKTASLAPAAATGHRAPTRSAPVMIRIFAVVRSALLTLFAVVGVACLLVFAGSLVFGVKPLVVISGSMEPTIPVGSVVLIRSVPAADLAVGDIVTVERPRGLGLITHRVVSTNPTENGSTELVLRGDANTVDDPEPYDVTTAGEYVWNVPGLGHLALFLQTRGGLVVAGAVALMLLAVFMLDPARMGRRDDEQDEGQSEMLAVFTDSNPTEEVHAGDRDDPRTTARVLQDPQDGRH